MQKIIFFFSAFFLSGCFGAGTWVKKGIPESQQDMAWNNDKVSCHREAISQVGAAPIMNPQTPRQLKNPTYNIEYKNQYGVPVGSATATPINTSSNLGSNTLGVTGAIASSVWSAQVGKLQRQCLASRGWTKIPN